MNREKVAIFVGGKLENIRGQWSMPGGILDNAYFEVLAFISDVETVIGQEIWNGMCISHIETLSEVQVDEVIIMAAEYEPYIESVRERLSRGLGISKERMVASMFIRQVPFIGNLGGITFDECVPRGKYVNLKYLLREGLIHGSNDLERFFLENNHRLIDKWTHYFEVYDREFNRFRNKRIRMLEIGVFSGGSLQMWKDYFGSQAEIIGVDINPKCKDYEEDQITVEIGSQEDPGFLNYLMEKYGCFDIVLDDGGHTMRQQIISFQMLFPAVSNGGIYLCEDCHTSYMKSWGGGYKKEGTFIEYAKELIDGINDQFISEEEGITKAFAGSIKSIRFDNSMVSIEKKNVGETIRLAW